jgi:hypothetical protein
LLETILSLRVARIVFTPYLKLLLVNAQQNAEC